MPEAATSAAEAAAAAMPELTWTVLPSNGQILVTETEELVKAGIAAVRADIAETPAWHGAPYPTDGFLLMFLRAEMFSPKMAGARYRSFWEVKVDLFGEGEAALPFKAEPVSEALRRQFCVLVPGSKDVEGRQVVLITPGNLDKKMDRKLRARAVWYVLLAALEDEETQRRGICIVADLRTTKVTNLDTKMSKSVLGTHYRGALPLRVGAINLCYPPIVFKSLWAILRVFLHERVRRRIRVVSGTDQNVVEALRCIISPEDLPPPMGSKQTNFDCWVADRVLAEG